MGARGCHLQNDLGGAREGEGAALREGEGVEDGEPGLGLDDHVTPQRCVGGGGVVGGAVGGAVGFGCRGHVRVRCWAAWAT